MWNVSSSKSLLQLPSIFHHLPHLLSRQDSLLPAVHVGQGRTGGEHTHTYTHTYKGFFLLNRRVFVRLRPLVSIVMGVPSVKREVHSYLSDTLSSLMSELSAAEKDDCVIVVLVAEVCACGVVRSVRLSSCSAVKTLRLELTSASVPD